MIRGAGCQRERVGSVDVFDLKNSQTPGDTARLRVSLVTGDTRIHPAISDHIINTP